KLDYDQLGRPKLTGDSPKLKDLGEEAYMHPEKVVEGLQFEYKPGQEVTLTAHVKNVGFKTAAPFSYVWMIDDKVVDEGKCSAALPEMDEKTFELKWKWAEGFHYATFKIETDQDEIAKINNVLKDPLWGFDYTYVVSKGRCDAWHQFRSGYGTFCFEDYYRWHVDIMNLLFENSVFPATPSGMKCRVRLDRIIYADQVKDNTPIIDGQPRPLVEKDNLRYDQGGWIWNDNEEELKTGKFIQVNPEWRNKTEWSLPHELGHQLGLVDWYALDCEGGDRHVMPDNGEPVSHFMNHPTTMMHWHGPQVYSEVDAAYLSDTWNKPRGYFGDMYFAIPSECFLRVVDINGAPVAGASVELFQRGTKLEPGGKPQMDQGVKYWPVIEDGDFYGEEVQQVTKDPVIAGETDADGMLRLPNRPVSEVVSLNGYHRKPNPFGNMNVVGQRMLMLVKVTKGDEPNYFFLEGHDFVAAWYRGQKDQYTTVLRTTYASVDSPAPPVDVTVTKVDEHHVKVTWSRPDPGESLNYTYLTRPIGYKVYERIGNMGLTDRPWFEVASVGPETFEVTVDLRERPMDTEWFSKVTRFAVSTLAETSRQSTLTTTILK
ncbi:MAG: hypothetical protein JXO22_17735, partial [Phycisphaerae bacterium]|nr:hypothetical protein [Phycisphaerae bacterium]